MSPAANSIHSVVSNIREPNNEEQKEDIESASGDKPDQVECKQ